MMSHNIVLRPWRENDLRDLTAVRNDVKLQALLMARVKGSTIDIVRDWAVRRTESPDSILFIVADRKLDDMLGYVQFVGIDPLDGCAEMGICIRSEVQGRGIGAEAIRLSISELQERGLRKVWLRVRDDNISALHCYAKLCFRRVGVLKKHSWWDDAFRDVIIMERLLTDKA